MPCGKNDDITVAEVLGTNPEARSEDRFGPIRHASITLSGCLEREAASCGALVTRENEDADGTVPYQYYMDERHVCSSTNSCPELYLFLLSYRVEYCSTKYFSSKAKEILHLQGLILARESEGYDTFNRVGFFQHDWKQEADKSSGKYPPFIDFDPRKFVRSVITLI
jgi:hypothetical protein